MIATAMSAARTRLLKAAARTAAVAVVERSLRAGEMSPLHVHADDEAYYVVDGAVTLWIEGDELVLGAGDSAIVPAGAAHAHRAETARARVRTTTTVASAARYDDFTRAVAIPVGAGMTPEEAGGLGAIAAANAIEILGPPGALPQHHL